MRRFFTVRHASALAVVLSSAAAMAALIGCAQMQPAIDVATAIGVSSGAITPGQADSITRTSRAVGKTFEDITPEQEYYIGRAVAATVLASYRPYDDQELTLYVNRVGQALAMASDRPETYGGWHFLVLDSPEINAFAAPGGLILVTRGMLKCCKSEDELAAVLAHEIGHVQGRHGLRAIRQDRLTSALTILATEGAKNFGGPQLAELTKTFEGSVSDVTSTLMNNGYSRQLEREADQSAVDLMRRVGYDPRALTGMLGEMATRLKPGGSDFAKTHPDPRDRIEDIASLVGPGLGAPPAARQSRFDLAMRRA
ncbi:MAG: M48 family metalloprotease [Syntrophobacteraceae bacterium]